MTHQAWIEKLSHDGRGIARMDGKTTFIEGALPHETVLFTYIRQKKSYDEGRIQQVLEPSVDRVQPLCPHYSHCGGCSLQHMEGEAQIHAKQALFLDIVARIAHLQPQHMLPLLTDRLWHYRTKARLSVHYMARTRRVHLGFRDKFQPKQLVDVQACVVLHEGFHLNAVRDVIASFDHPESIPQVELAAGEAETALIFRHLVPLSQHDQEKLQTFAAREKVRVFLQAGDAKSVVLFYPADDHVFLNYTLPAYSIEFLFHPTDFTQVNPGLNRQMIARALELMDLKADDVVLDLFCGLGNFSLPMARFCKQVVGIEGSDMMVARAHRNAAYNGLENVDFLCLNLDREHVVDDRFHKLLIDPPRTGALNIVQNIEHIAPERIVYVSCNPATFARDADILVHQKGYTWVSAGVMNMFPHTTHVESIALFIKG